MDSINKGSGPSLDIANFIPHDDNCLICKTNTPTLIHKTDAHMKLFDREFAQIGMLKLSNMHKRKYFLPSDTLCGVVVSLTLQIEDDMTWCIFVDSNKIQNDSQPLQLLPSILSDVNVKEFCSKLNNLNICNGNSDFEDVLSSRVDLSEPFPNSSGDRVAWVEASLGKTKLIKESFDTIRSVQCHFVVSDGSSVCQPCKLIRNKLLKYRARLEFKSSESVEDDSHTNIRYLTIPQLHERIRNLSISRRAAINKAARYSVVIDRMIAQNGVAVNNDQHLLLKEVIENNSPSFTEGTPQALLWQQQIEQASKCNKRSMRWHPLIIRWCLSIYHSSPAAYRQMASKRNNFIILPHVNTLKKYINFTEPVSGFNPDIIDRLVENSHIGDIPEFQKNVTLMIDEIKIKSGLAYKRSSGKLIGFTEMGDLNEEVARFRHSCDESRDADERDFATYVNVFMVRGLCSSLCYPFGYHAGLGFTADQLFPLVWEATRVLEAIGFKVCAWTCDGASPNRKFFKINACHDDNHWTWNIYDLRRKIYFISDPPHLLKTLRNNLENSHGNRNSRNLHVSVINIFFYFIYMWFDLS